MVKETLKNEFDSEVEHENNKQNGIRKNMKMKTLIAAAVAAVALAAATSQAQVMIQLGGGNIQFASSGNTFDFPGTTGVTSPGTDTGLTFTLGGTFTLGAPVGSNPYTSTVSGSGMISSADGFSGNYSLVDLSTFNFGATVNDQLAINVTGITYSGSNGDLKALAAAGDAVLILTFQGYTLPTLYNTPPTGDISYSGTLQSAVPEPSTVVAGALMLLPLGIGAVRAIRKERTA